MKICDLTQSYAATGGGVRTYLHSKIGYLRQHAPEARHLLLIPGERDTTRRDGRFTVRTVASPLLPGSKAYRLLWRSDKVARILEQERPDIIDAHCAYNLPWTALHHRRRHAGARVIGTYMTDLPRAYVRPVAARFLGKQVGDRANELAERYVRALYGRMDAAVAISPAQAARLAEMGVGNVECIPLGVDLETFHPSHRDPALRRRLGVGEDELLLVYAGRIDLEKRPELVMEAFTRLPPSLRAVLVLVGDGPSREALAKRAHEHGRAHVLPFMSERAELARLLASADIYVSAMPFETFGLSIVEAQASGLPVVGVAGGAMVERVPEGAGVGLLGRVNSVEDLASNIEAMAGSDLREAGRRARALVESQFSWKRTFDRTLSLYERVLARGRTGLR